MENTTGRPGYNDLYMTRLIGGGYRPQAGGQNPEKPAEELPGEKRTDQESVEQGKTISIFGYKISYSKAFGIAFLVIFILLFFPGIGVSSSGMKGKKENEEMVGNTPQKK